MQTQTMSELLHPLTGEPLAPVGYVNGRAVWPVLGAAPGDADDDDAGDDADDIEVGDDADDEDEGDGGGGHEEGDGEGEETVEELRTRLAKSTAALKKANKEAERLRRATKKPARPTAGPKPTRPKPRDEDDDDAEERAAQADARAAASETRTKRLSATVALAAEGLTKSQAKRLAGMLDLDAVDLDDDGDADWDDQIEELKEDFPQLFKKDEDEEEPPKRRRRRPTTADRPAPAGGGKKLTASQKQAMALRGGR